MFIGIHDMNAEYVIGKLMIIENDPGKIWKALEATFGKGYFQSAIEKMLGITSEYKELLL